MYVIMRTDQGGGFLSTGGGAAYTFNIEYIRLFDTREQAERERCPGNEIVLPLEAVAGQKLRREYWQ